MAAGVVHIPWYATLFRSDAFEAALRDIAAVALRYGATDYRVYRSRDDQYKFLQMASFEDKRGWEAYWYGPEFNQFRAECSSWYQVPVMYAWNDLVVEGGMDHERAGTNGPPAARDTV
jgi:hypothetical protein